LLDHLNLFRKEKLGSEDFLGLKVTHKSSDIAQPNQVQTDFEMAVKM
jgi:hypothetical protein